MGVVPYRPRRARTAGCSEMSLRGMKPVKRERRRARPLWSQEFHRLFEIL
jgi:hypothetical protein